MSGAYVVHVKKDGWKKAKLLGSDGKIVGLRVYAVIFADKERAEVACQEIIANNPGYTARVGKA
jgi:hypothetical protein